MLVRAALSQGQLVAATAPCFFAQGLYEGHPVEGRHVVGARMELGAVWLRVMRHC